MYKAKKLLGFCRRNFPSIDCVHDGVANQQGSRVGVVIVSPNGIVLEKSLRLFFSATNSIEVFSDSQLIVGQVLGEYKAKDVRMQAYLGKIKQLQAHFREFTLKQVPRCRNSHADSLATLATMSDGALSQLIIMEELNKPRWKDWSRTMVWSVRAIPS